MAVLSGPLAEPALPDPATQETACVPVLSSLTILLPLSATKSLDPPPSTASTQLSPLGLEKSACAPVPSA